MATSASEAPTTVDKPTQAQRSSRLSTAVPGIALAALIIGICAWPLASAKAFYFADWIVHLWYIWHQEGSLRAHGLPSLFAHDTAGVFDPHFAFYGGTLYTIAGAAALVVGPHAAYLATWLMAFAMAYGGWFWLARQAGLGPWASHVPGVVFITSSWYISSAYFLGAWGQVIASGALVLGLAAVCSILRADRLRPLPALALAISAVLYTGSHTLTLVWATTMLVIAAGAALVVIAPLRTLVTRRGLLRVAVVVVPAVMVNAWFLLPAAVYQSHTNIGSDVASAHSLLTNSMKWVAVDHVLSLGRAPVEPIYTRFAAQLPLLAAGWVVAGLILLRPSRNAPWLRASLLLLVMAVATWVLMTSGSLLLSLPHPYDMLQNPVRLEAYILFALGGALIATLVLTQRASPRHRLWAWATVPLLAVSVVQANGQLRQAVKPPPPGEGELATISPYHRSDFLLGTQDYVDARVPIYDDPALPIARFSPTQAEREDRAETTVNAKPGEFVISNLKAFSELIHISGARLVARNRYGDAFLEIAADAKPGAARIVVTTAHPWPVMVGRFLTLLGLVGLAGLGATLLVRARRTRRTSFQLTNPRSPGSQH
jgi:hypothetical protein